MPSFKARMKYCLTVRAFEHKCFRAQRIRSLATRKYCFDSKCLRAKVLPCTRMYRRLATCTSAALTARVYYDTECFRAQNTILRDKRSAYAHQCVSHTEVLLMRYMLYKHEMRSRTEYTATWVCTELLRQHRLYGHRCDGRTK